METALSQLKLLHPLFNTETLTETIGMGLFADPGSAETQQVSLRARLSEAPVVLETQAALAAVPG